MFARLALRLVLCRPYRQMQQSHWLPYDNEMLGSRHALRFLSSRRVYGGGDAKERPHLKENKGCCLLLSSLGCWCVMWRIPFFLSFHPPRSFFGCYFKLWCKLNPRIKKKILNTVKLPYTVTVVRRAPCTISTNCRNPDVSVFSTRHRRSKPSAIFKSACSSFVSGTFFFHWL